MLLYVTKTIRIIRDGEPRTATSNFTQLLNSNRELYKRSLLLSLLVFFLLVFIITYYYYY